MSASPHNELIAKLDYFKNVTLFKNLNEPQIKTLLKIMHREHFAADSFIMREGGKGAKLYILLSDEVAITKSLVLPQWMQNAQKSEKALIRLSEKQYPFFGEMSMFDEHSVREASIRALRPCEMVSMEKDALQAILEKNPQTGRIVYCNIARELVHRLRKANRDILKLTTAFTLALEG